MSTEQFDFRLFPSSLPQKDHRGEERRATITVNAVMGISFLVPLVRQAVYEIDRHLNPRSADYADPGAALRLDLGNRFREQSSSYYSNNANVPFIQKTMQSRHGDWIKNVQLVKEFIKYRNYVGHEEWLVGADWFELNIYLAMVHYNNWVVQDILKTHAESGKNFGSATGFQTQDPLEGLRDWPEKYKLDLGSNPVEILVMPNKREGYFDQPEA